MHKGCVLQLHDGETAGLFKVVGYIWVIFITAVSDLLSTTNSDAIQTKQTLNNIDPDDRDFLEYSEKNPFRATV